MFVSDQAKKVIVSDGNRRRSPFNAQIVNGCKLWIEACRRPDLIGKTCKQLKNTYICSAHFENHLYGKKSLKKIAIPTLLLPIKGTRSVHTQTDPASGYFKDAELNSDDDITDSNIDEGPRHRDRAVEATQEVPHASGAELGSGGCICKFCQREIIGFRYTCVQCEDVELCSACEAKDRHCLHYVLRIPESRPQEEVERVLCRIRHELKAGLQPVAAKGANDSDKTDDTHKADNTHDPADTVNADTVNADSVKVEVKEEPDPGPDPLQDSSLNTAYDLELTSELDIKIEKEWLDEEIKEEMKEENFAVFTHSAVEATRDKIPQKRPSHNITTIPEKKPYFSIESNASSCSGSGVHIDKNLKLLTKPPLRLNESSNFEIHKHASGGQINKATLPQGNEEGSSVKKKNN
ncbi:uncharacterized protein LOC113228177 isoform X2 [Hyposmocoma kahamanoa]|uniref:uncharacterized protein LOC113228177 isoform X2 n=1 Tax=Hyposmocoma kahamanoa TaxID=1477025 RepID=UPI000E6D5CFC|nr:uncharacterized protein LOC113228177 isoform X2 [Hyposmocoma kahamanoa]